MNKNKLIAAYSDFMRHLHETMEDTLHSFAEALEISKEKTGKDSDLTRDELDKVSGFVKRDIEHAAQGLSAQEDNDSLSEWFKFDIELIENFTLDAFLSLADKTRLELARLGQIAEAHTYHSGDITVPGTFTCDDCGKEIAFKSPSEIPDCPKCHGKTFIRI
ncbi:MAG: zinc ribbon-containing protein [Methylobacter sp.]|nr:zinc ribbon-containing protein [Methylobacter sp.]MDP2428973.1 zinc ribbon-containing protein [Methylobacter sp.]MDP3055257.1 zinc ribbon-containing protein [Methylobacter sp.]MDP3361285.1 zinc ribbon-containing protein [Methylobacter sp.]MDZ4219260.1 zinc ribbon-containing protein [Methylobacter sp.]